MKILVFFYELEFYWSWWRNIWLENGVCVELFDFDYGCVVSVGVFVFDHSGEVVVVDWFWFLWICDDGGDWVVSVHVVGCAIGCDHDVSGGWCVEVVMGEYGVVG